MQRFLSQNHLNPVFGYVESSTNDDDAIELVEELLDCRQGGSKMKMLSLTRSVDVGGCVQAVFGVE